ncbi:MAG: hypothetical protein KIS61_32135 [Candidatus Eremiobacteraeota bacterium]|nr:hypothetical protein [Candidatus Eremiobacteraeota bacterium]
MLKRNIPEFLASIFMALLLLGGYAMRGQMPWPTHYPTPRSHVQPRFLLEVETPRGTLTVGNHGEISGLQQGRLGETDLNDLRLAAQLLKPAKGGGTWKLRFYDAEGAHESSFDPARADAETRHVLENLRILGYLEMEPVHQQAGQSRPQ